MATTAALATRLDRSLHSLLAEVAELPAVAAEWPELPEIERAYIALDWDHLMASYLTELAEAFQSGTMTDEQAARYRLLLRELQEAMPLIERLDLYRPPVPRSN